MPPHRMPAYRMTIVVAACLVFGGAWSLHRIHELEDHGRNVELENTELLEALEGAEAENTHLREAYNQLSEYATRRGAVDATTNSLNAARDRITELQKQDNQLENERKRLRDDR